MRSLESLKRVIWTDLDSAAKRHPNLNIVTKELNFVSCTVSETFRAVEHVELGSVSKVKQLLSVLSANESFSMFQLTNQGCFSQHPGFLPSEDAISMPPPVSEALLPQYL